MKKCKDIGGGSVRAAEQRSVPPIFKLNEHTALDGTNEGSGKKQATTPSPPPVYAKSVANNRSRHVSDVSARSRSCALPAACNDQAPPTPTTSSHHFHDDFGHSFVNPTRSGSRLRTSEMSERALKGEKLWLHADIFITGSDWPEMHLQCFLMNF